MRFERILLTCEHATNRIPARYRTLFRDAEEILESHRGYDPGALALTRALSRHLGVPYFATDTSRLLVEGNRSTGHPAHFSEFTKTLPETERDFIIEKYYRPFRRSCRHAIDAMMRRDGFVLHLSVHSFTPVWRGEERRVDVALLYDPSRRPERELCDAWIAALRRADPTLRIRRNNPYRGIANAHTTELRRSYGAPKYAGIEIEVNQRVLAVPNAPGTIGALLTSTLRTAAAVKSLSAHRRRS
ncbi:MAG: N-formylglutamate amidohydrolase [Deltaproteobacteria bacterium]|nr:N-formylglutamate amidohydrolase [Deltaproteobacteria bacterium]